MKKFLSGVLLYFFNTLLKSIYALSINLQLSNLEEMEGIQQPIFFQDIIQGHQNNIHNHESQVVPVFTENQGVGLNEFREFVDYWIQHRNSAVIENYQDPRTGIIHQFVCNNFIPLEPGETIPTIIFTRNSENTIVNCGISLPRLTTGHAVRTARDGTTMNPLFNLEQNIETYYHYGLKEGRLADIHRFVLDLKFAFDKGFEIETYLRVEKREFRFINNNCEDNRYYYV